MQPLDPLSIVPLPYVRYFRCIYDVYYCYHTLKREKQVKVGFTRTEMSNRTPDKKGDVDGNGGKVLLGRPSRDRLAHSPSLYRSIKILQLAAGHSLSKEWSVSRRWLQEHYSE